MFENSYYHIITNITTDDTFVASDSIYAIARYMLSPVRPSVRPSVRHTGGSVKDG